MECPLCGHVWESEREANGPEALGHFVMTEIDLLARSSFEWIDINGDGLILMASGMNGQRFRFNGYLPTDKSQRAKTLRELESESYRNGGTEIFMETPYRNDAMREAVLQTCRGTTRLCIAVEIGSEREWIRTLPVSEWKSRRISLHKRPAVFLISAT